MLDELTEQGLLSETQRQTALLSLHPGYQWRQWAFALLMGGGALLVLAGIIFFFAFNWDSLPNLAKLALPQLAMVGAALLAWWRGRNVLSGQLALLAASVLIGVFMAVFGQVYQTGADAWQLFANWALLMVFWVLISRFAIHWGLWLLVANLAIWLWWQQVWPETSSTELYAFLSMAVLNLLALSAREYLALEHKFDWLAPDWIRWLLIAANVGILSPLALSWLAGLDLTDTMPWVGLLAMLALLGMAWIYRTRFPDLPGLAMLGLSLCLILTASVASRLSDWDVSTIPSTFLTGLVALGSFTIAASYLRRLKSQWEGVDAND